MIDGHAAQFRLARRAGGICRRTAIAEFSYILIDCPPSLSLLTVNAMAAADAVLVPLQCEFFALEGLSQLLKTIELVRANLNPTLEIQGVVLTMFDKRNKLSDQVAADVRGPFRRQGLSNDDPAQRAYFRGAEPWSAGAGLRSCAAREARPISSWRAS